MFEVTSDVNKGGNDNKEEKVIKKMTITGVRSAAASREQTQGCECFTARSAA